MVNRIAQLLYERQNPPPVAPLYAPAMNLAEALADPKLFGPLFEAASWRSWKIFIRALFALPIAPRQLSVYQQHTGRTSPPSQPFREAALVIGRRGGKSRILALIAVYLATFRDYREFLAPAKRPL